MAFGKKNHVKLDLATYNVCLLGESKVGKTTLMYQVCKKLFGDDGYLFLECGNERGADAIEGINHINCPSWNADYDELFNSAGLQDVIDDIIENKTEEYPNLRVIILDTEDQVIDMAEEEAIRLWNKDNPDKRAKSINGAWGGYGEGKKKAVKLISSISSQLSSVGVQVWTIGHTKTKDLTDSVSGETYQTLTSDQQQLYFNTRKKALHFLGLAYIDREIIKEKTGKKDIKNKDIVVNKVSQETRKIKFRDDNYAVDSGSRFAEIVPEVAMSADNFIKALEDAIKMEQAKSGKSYDESKEEQDKETEARNEKIKKDIELKKIQAEIDGVKKQIVNFFSNNKEDLDKIVTALSKVKEYGYENPTEIDNLECAKEILGFVLSL